MSIAVGDKIFLGIQNFDFTQIQLNLPKSNHFCSNFALILPKFNQFFPKKNFARRCAAASPASAALSMSKWL